MYRDPAAPGDIADHLITWNRLATLGVADHQVVETLDPDPTGGAPDPADQSFEGRRRPRLQGLGIRVELLHDRREPEIAPRSEERRVGKECRATKEETP